MLQYTISTFKFALQEIWQLYMESDLNIKKM
jgi:hypothetical protein